MSDAANLRVIHAMAARALSEIRQKLKPDGYRLAVVIAHPLDREMDIVVTDADVPLLMAVLQARRDAEVTDSACDERGAD